MTQWVNGDILRSIQTKGGAENVPEEYGQPVRNVLPNADFPDRHCDGGRRPRSGGAMLLTAAHPEVVVREQIRRLPVFLYENRRTEKD